MKPIGIEVEAAKALAEWKSRFAAEVCERAKQIAARSSQPDRITLSHYRTAAEAALEVLAGIIRGEQPAHGKKEAA